MIDWFVNDNYTGEPFYFMLTCCIVFALSSELEIPWFKWVDSRSQKLREAGRERAATQCFFRFVARSGTHLFNFFLFVARWLWMNTEIPRVPYPGNRQTLLNGSPFAGLPAGLASRVAYLLAFSQRVPEARQTLISLRRDHKSHVAIWRQCWAHP
jgi:hypothetical protein